MTSPPKFFSLFLLFFLLGTPLFSEDDPNFDPDFFFDNIGAEPSVPNGKTSSHDRNFGDRVITGIDNFGSGVLLGSITNNQADAARGTLVNPANGRIIVVGRANNGTDNDFMIMAYNPGGTLDTTFNTNGKHLASFGSSSSEDWAHGVSLQTDGKPVVVGRTDSGAYSYAILRLTTGGALDTSFNTSGKIRTTFNNLASLARSVVMDTTGRVLVGGYTLVSGVYNFSAARYTSDGRIDTAFETDGRIMQVPATLDAGVFGISIYTDGTAAVMLGGASWNGVNFDFAAIRLASSGSLDTAFSTDGKATLDFAASGREDIAYDVEVAANGKIVLGGAHINAAGNLDFAAARYLSQGSLDTSFATTGLTAVSITNAQPDVAYSLEINTFNSVYLGGYTGSTRVYALMRLSSSGALDTGFNTNGKQSLAVGSADDTAQSVDIVDEDIIILAGRSQNGSGNFDVAVARYNTDGTLAQAGALDKTFRPILVEISGSDTGRSGAVQTDGKILQPGAGTFGSLAQVGIARYTKTGSLDTTFHTDGKHMQTWPAPQSGATTSYQVIVQTDGRIVTSGSGPRNNNHGYFRFHTDGRLDTTFYTRGMVDYDINSENLEQSRGISLASDGKLYGIGGFNNGAPFQVLRLLTDGFLDTSFATSGRTHYSTSETGRPERMVFLANGKLALSSRSGGNDFTAVRLESSGALDTSFHTDGLGQAADSGLSFDIGFAIAAQEDEKLVVTGTAGGAPVHFLIGRWLTSGNVDTTFYTDGVRHEDFNLSGNEAGYGISVMPGGKILVVGSTGPDITALRDYVIYRFMSDGYVDTTFNTDGISTLHISGLDDGNALIFTNIGKACITGASGGEFSAACFWQ